MITRVLHLPPLPKIEHKIDWQGAVALVVGLVPLLLIAEQGQSWGWTSTAALLCYGTGALGLALFVLAERVAGKDALLPLYLFLNKTFSISAGANVIIGLGMFGGLATLPLYLQIAKGMTPTQAGLTLIPLTLGIMIGSVIAGQLVSRTGRYKVFPIIGTILLGIGALLMSRLQPGTTLTVVGIDSIVFGLGLGLTMQPLVLAVQNAVPPREMGVATSSSLFFRQVGGSLGTAIFLSILFTRAGENIPSELAKSGQQLPAGQSFDLNDTSGIKTLPETIRHPILVGFSNAMDTVFFVGGCVLILAFGIYSWALEPLEDH